MLQEKTRSVQIFEHELKSPDSQSCVKGYKSAVILHCVHEFINCAPLYNNKEYAKRNKLKARAKNEYCICFTVLIVKDISHF